MRPLSLTISGLHSFRNERTIDFTRLVQDRLFGIFGPTGSGKSTILDAMTLALFGQIERTAGSRVQSAITSGLNDCRVAFTFDLLVEGERRRFTAERAYRVRASGMRSEVRLAEHDREQPDDLEKMVVLAEKGKEMEEAIDNLLGISHEDFSRAVILPQGSFARFLSMGNAERGVMLKRIFGLEELDNRVTGRLKGLYSTLKTAQENREGRLTELEKFNDEVLAEREKEFEVAETESKVQRAALEKVEKECGEKEELLGQITQLTMLVSQSEEREKERAELEKLEALLKLAADAAEVEGSVEAERSAAGREAEAAKKLKSSEEAKKNAEEVLAPLAQKKEKADRERADGGAVPTLAAEIETLGGLVDLDREIGLLLGEMKEREEKGSALKVDLDKQSQVIATLREQDQKLLAEEEELKKRSEGLAVDLKELERKQRTIEDLLAASERVEKSAATVTAQRAEEKKSEENLARITKESERLTGALETLRSTLKESLARLELRRRENAVASLLPHLIDGEPCPLCGSEEHPHRHEVDPATDTAPLEKEIAELEVKLEHARNAAAKGREEMKGVESQLHERRTAREQRVAEQNEAEKELQGLLERGKYSGKSDPETLRTFHTTCTTKIAEIEGKSTTASKRKDAVALLRRESTEKIGAEEQQIATLTATIDSTGTELKRATEKLSERRTARTARLEATGLDASAVPEGTATDLLSQKKSRHDELLRRAKEIDDAYASAEQKNRECATLQSAARATHEQERKNVAEKRLALDERLKAYHFPSLDAWKSAFLPREERDRQTVEATAGRNRLREAEADLLRLKESVGERTTTDEEVEGLRKRRDEATTAHEMALKKNGDASRALTDCRDGNRELKKLQSESAEQGKEFMTVKKLRKYLEGNAFIDFVANDRLRHICRTASKELRHLTGGRLQIDAESGTGFFVIDNASGGEHRPTGSLSGGETFLVSLALALSLSESLQLRGAPLEFFFLDEGFGTLDADLLDTVMDALDRIRSESHRTIGIISHVRELHERIPRHLVVSPATETEGTDVRVEVG